MIRVLVVDKVRLMCNLVAAVLKSETEIEVVGCATSSPEALTLAAGSDVILLSATLPDNGAVELTRQIVKANPEAKVVIFGLAESDAVILRYIEAGAVGYVLREHSIQELLRTVRAAHSKEALISPGVAAMLMTRLAELAQISQSVRPQPRLETETQPDLTRRERQVLNLIAQGYCNQEIAQHLAIQLGTAKNHVHNILDKLNVSSRKDAAAYLTVMQNQLS